MTARKKKSGKRSGASSKRRKVPPLTYFVDECLGGRLLVDLLSATGAQVVLSRDHFPAGTRDVDWLPIVGAKEWVVLTKDRHIRRRQLEIDALTNARVRAFVLTAADLTGAEQAAVFVKALPRIERICRATRGPIIGAIGESGGISMLRLPRRRRLRRRTAANA